MVGSGVLRKDSIRLGVTAKDPEEAIRMAGNLLVQAGCVVPSYVEEMVDTYKRLGGYIVIAPGLALPHARPEAGVNRTGFSLITLAEPVQFGNVDNDPVRVVVCMAARDSSEHIAALQGLATAFSQPGVIEAVAGTDSVDEVLRLLCVRSCYA
jgi:mannitol/fructose-specific phosphotransferase system IIA component (Ntr-type)